jgi:hypothetical protein
MTVDDRAERAGAPVCPVCVDVRGVRVPMELKRPEGEEFVYFECPTCHIGIGDRRREPREKPPR